MRHQTHYISAGVTDTRDTVQGAVRVGLVGDAATLVAVTEDHAARRLEVGDDFRISKVVSFPMRDRNPKHLTRRCERREWCVGLLHTHGHVLAVKLQIAITQ